MEFVDCRNVRHGRGLRYRSDFKRPLNNVFSMVKRPARRSFGSNSPLYKAYSQVKYWGMPGGDGVVQKNWKAQLGEKPL